MAIGRSAYDRFRGRLLWPIRDSSGDTIGFGARRIFDDDRIEAKYLNTPETPIYKKSQVLYGIDLARRDIARSSQAVIVEGYTDVMACHLAGVTTAVATCGTSFGDDHARVLRRFLHDHEEFRGEVIFTFDGDAAGQKAALRAFGGDQNFVSQTYVAVEPDGMDPCDLRIKQGDAAVRELVARRVPLYRFVLTNVVSSYDLDRADGRVDALREARAAGLQHPRQVQGRRVRPRARRDGRDRRRGGRGSEVRRAANRPAAAPAPRRQRPGASRRPPTSPRARRARPARPAVRDRAGDPQAGHPAPDGDRPDHGRHRPNDFTHPTYRAVWELVAAAGGPAAGAADAGWATKPARLGHRPGGLRRRSARSASSRCSRRRSPTRRTSACTSSGCSSSPRCAGSPR